MNALDVISLDSAKKDLVVDFSDRDVEITRHIKSAVSIIEQYTDVYLYQREVEYVLQDCSLEIYDSPLEWIGTTPERLKNRAMSVIVYGKKGDSYTANVGYADVEEIPQNLVDACYKIITYLFENKDIYSVSLPLDVQMLVNQWRRSASV